MRRRRRRIRWWLVLAATLATLSIAASASAMPAGDSAGGTSVYPQSAVGAVDGTGGSTWWYVVIAAVAMFGLTLTGAAIVRHVEQRRRLARLAH